jgi:hypothetical protein
LSRVQNTVDYERPLQTAQTDSLKESFWHVYVVGAAYFVWSWKSRVPWYRDVTAGTLTATDTYALRMHMCGRG